MSDDLTRMWDEINHTKERVVKVESRAETLERQHQDQMRQMSRAETNFNAGVEKISASQDEFFAYMRAELESLKKDRDTREGFEDGRRAATEAVLKKAKLWVGIPAAILALLGVIAFFKGGGA